MTASAPSPASSGHQQQELTQMIAVFAFFMVILPAVVLAANVFDTFWFAPRGDDRSPIDDPAA